MFKILLPAVAALGLVAFAAKTQPVVTEAAPTQATSAVEGASSMGWHVSHEGETAKLAYGVANSDQLAMMVTCAPGDATAAVYGDVRPEGSKAAASSMDETRVPVRAVALRDLADKGSMTVVGEGGAYRVAATANERRAIGEFLDYCDRKQA
ncbi:hypothetical protein BH09PSE1_BH09PSE1_23300 [soil metagenome]